MEGKQDDSVCENEHCPVHDGAPVLDVVCIKVCRRIAADVESRDEISGSSKPQQRWSVCQFNISLGQSGRLSQDPGVHRRILSWEPQSLKLLAGWGAEELRTKCLEALHLQE